MARSNLGLGFVFSAINGASPVIRTIGRDLNMLAATSDRAGKRLAAGLGLGFIGATMAGFGRQFLQSASAFSTAGREYEAALAQLGAIVRADAQGLRELENTAIKTASNTKFTTLEAVGAMQQLGQAGYDAAQSAQAVGAALSLAQGGGTTIEKGTDALIAAQKVFSLSTTDSAKTADTLLAITRDSSLTVEELGVALGGVSRGAQIADQSLESMLVTIGLIRNTGAFTSKSANAVSSALTEMADKSGIFKKLVGVNVEDANGKLRDLSEVFIDVRESLVAKGIGPASAEGASIIKKLFGRFGMQAYTAVINQLFRSGVKNAQTGAQVFGKEALRQLMEGAGAGAVGAGEDFNNRVLATFDAQATRFMARWKDIQDQLGMAFNHALGPAMKVLADLSADFENFFNELTPGARAAVVGFIGLTGAAMVLTGAMTLGLSVLFLFSGAFIAMAGAAVIAAAAVAGLTAIGAGLFVAWQDDIGGFKTGALRLFEQVKLGFMGLVQGIRDGYFSGAVMDELNKAENVGVKQFVVQAVVAFRQLKVWFEGFVQGLKDNWANLRPSFDALVGSFQELLRTLGLFAPDTIQGITDATKPEMFQRGAKAGKGFVDVLQHIVDALRVIIDVTTDLTRGTLGSWEGFKAAVAGVALVFVTMAEASMRALQGITKLASWNPVSKTFELITGENVLGEMSTRYGQLADTQGDMRRDLYATATSGYGAQPLQPGETRTRGVKDWNDANQTAGVAGQSRPAVTAQLQTSREMRIDEQIAKAMANPTFLKQLQNSTVPNVTVKVMLDSEEIYTQIDKAGHRVNSLAHNQAGAGPG